MPPRVQRPRRTPQRRCVACRTARDKRDLVRLAITADGRLAVDEAGKGPGRGAYICRCVACWTDPAVARRVGQALRATLSADDVRYLAEYGTRFTSPSGDRTIGADHAIAHSGQTTNG